MPDNATHKINRIGVAIVLEEGRVIVGTRSEEVHLGGKDEFPGGKCEQHEPPESCAVRECFEECGLHVVPTTLLHQEEYHYPDQSVELWFILCRPKQVADPVRLKHPFRWVELNSLKDLDFPDGNRQVLTKLLDGYSRTE